MPINPLFNSHSPARGISGSRAASASAAAGEKTMVLLLSAASFSARKDIMHCRPDQAFRPFYRLGGDCEIPVVQHRAIRWRGRPLRRAEFPHRRGHQSHGSRAALPVGEQTVPSVLAVGSAALLNDRRARAQPTGRRRGQLIHGHLLHEHG